MFVNMVAMRMVFEVVVVGIAEVVDTNAEVVDTDVEVVDADIEVVDADAEVVDSDVEVVDADAEVISTVVCSGVCSRVWTVGRIRRINLSSAVF